MIIRFKNPTTGEVEEKHSKQSSDSMEFFNDKKTHLFTLGESQCLLIGPRVNTDIWKLARDSHV